MTRTGRCLCGQISYEISGDLIATAVCHCEHCQRQSGGAFSVNLVVQESQLAVTGTLSTFEDRGEHALGQGAREPTDELDLARVDPLVDELVDGGFDHGGVARAARPDPGIRELLLVRAVELLGRPQRGHRPDFSAGWRHFVERCAP